MSIASLKSAIVAGVVAASTAPAALASQIFINYPFQGVRHIHRIESDPQWDMHIIEIDLKAPGIRFRFTEPNGPDVPGELTLETTRAYLNRVGAQIAINAGSYFINPQYPYADNYYLGVSDGVRYSPFTYGESAINISQDNVATIIEQDPADRNQGIPSYNSVPKVDLYNAIGGKERIITNGINVAGTTEGCNQSDDCHNRHPRTAIGVTADQKLLLFTVDGRQPGHSVGMTTPEVADILLEYGAVDAINLDGGGSTTLVMSQDGAARVLNRPSDGSERAVAGNLAIFTQPLATQTTTLRGPGVFYEVAYDSTGSNAPITDWDGAGPGINYPYLELREYQSSDGEFDQRVFIRIDLSSIPAGALLTGVKLGLYHFDAYGGSNVDYLDLSYTTDPFTGQLTRNTYDGTNLWTDGPGAGIDGYLRTFPPGHHLASVLLDPSQPGYVELTSEAFLEYIRQQIAVGEDAYLVLSIGNGDGNWQRLISTGDGVYWVNNTGNAAFANVPYLEVTYALVPEPAAATGALIVGGIIAAAGRPTHRQP